MPGTSGKSGLFLLCSAAAVAGAYAATPTAVDQSCMATMNGQLPANTPSDFHFSGNVRRYYVAAEEEEWNFAPTGWDNWLGVPMNVSPRAQQSTKYGTTYLKALYRGYTDASFSQKTEQAPWQGTQGPTLRSEVGDLIEIMFINRLSRNYATMHSMGLSYSKMNEGADYVSNPEPGQNATIPLGDAVPPMDSGVAPGECVVYKWMVQDGAGPNAGEPARAHSYHSYIDLLVDTNSGLIGPQIVYAAGQMSATTQKYKEFTLLYMIYHENESFLSGINAQKLGGSQGSQSGQQRRDAQGPQNGHGSQNGYGPQNGHGPQHGQGFPGAHGPQHVQGSQSVEAPQQTSALSTYAPQQTPASGGMSTESMMQPYAMNTETLWPGNYSVWHPQVTNLNDSMQFSSASNFHSMNGYIFANNPVFEMCQDDEVIWYAYAYGSASHVFHMHGNSVVDAGRNQFAVSINDGVSKTLYMNATGVGLWQVICHVNNHQQMGMVADYRIWPSGQCPVA